MQAACRRLPREKLLYELKGGTGCGRPQAAVLAAPPAGTAGGRFVDETGRPAH
jgi:hypothetical protein